MRHDGTGAIATSGEVWDFGSPSRTSPHIKWACENTTVELFLHIVAPHFFAAQDIKLSPLSLRIR